MNMGRGFGNPGGYLTSNNRFSQLLAQQKDPNNGTVGGGLASILQKAMMGYMMGKDQSDSTAADAAMMRGMSAKDWQPPEGETIFAGPTGTETLTPQQAQAKIAPAGGYDGGIAALQGMTDNPYAGRYAQQLMMGRMTRDQSLADTASKRAYEDQIYDRNRADAVSDKAGDREFNLKIELMKSDRRLREMFDKMMMEDRFARQRSADDPYLKAGLPPPSQGVPAGAQQPAPQGVQPQPAPQVPGQQGMAPQPAPAPTTGPQALAQAQAQMEAEKVRAREQAKAQVGAQTDLPRVNALTDEMLGVLDKIATFDNSGNPKSIHPGLEGMVGMPESVSGFTSRIPFIGGPVPGTEGANFQTVMDQVGGKQFLQAYETLKGGGQITEIEGQQAKNAIARMNTAQSEQAFLEAVREFRGIIENARARAVQNAGGQQPAGEEFDYVPGRGLVPRGQ